jgi:hypothetical protein
MAQPFDSAAYHEAGHITAAVVQAMPLRKTGVHLDLYGHGCADYFQRGPHDPATTDLDHKERKLTIIALFAAHIAQLRFYPDCEQDGWRDDFHKIRTLSSQIIPDDESQQQRLEEEMRQRAKRLVDSHWPIIEELAQALLAKPLTPMAQEDSAWGIGGLKRNIPGSEIVEFFDRHGIRAKVVGDDVRNYDSTQDIPHYDSLALPPDL